MYRTVVGGAKRSAVELAELTLSSSGADVERIEHARLLTLIKNHKMNHLH